ncbi:MAG TPA: hypothetical protein VMI33_16715 [Streptosporangiaceae bacterium]|nr:hypothetical protein [Streptosporangiaceae bacterium]
MSAVDLIRKKETVPRSQLSSAEPAMANVAVIYADAAGRLTTLADWQKLSWSQRRASKYLTRYEVDMSDHQRTASFQQSPLPSKGGSYFFQCIADVGFRVHDPFEVIRHNVTDPLAIVYSHLLNEFWPITRRYSIEQAEEAQDEINEQLRHQLPVRLPGSGVEIYLCRTRILPDTAAQEHLRSLDAAKRKLELSQAKHEVDLVSSTHAHTLAERDQRARLSAQQRELDVWTDKQVDLRNLVLAHLARHPDETAYALELLERHEQATAAKRDLDDKRSIDLIRYMMEQGLIHSADVEVLRKQSLQRVQDIASPTGPPELAGTSWDEPLPAGPQPVVLVSSHGDPQAPPPGDPAARPAPAVLIPIYLAIDESPDDQAYFDALNAGLADLPSQLSAHQDVIRAVRFGVLGYAGDVRLCWPPGEIAPDSLVPELGHRGGSRLGPVFEYLRKRIPDDVQRLKSQSSRVGRPIVHILSASPPEDAAGWQVPYGELLNRGTFPYAPNVIACGIGRAAPDVVRLLAPPPEFGWLASPDLPLAEAVARYISYVQSSAIAVSSAHISGSQELLVTPPAGFEPAGDPAPSTPETNQAGGQDLPQGEGDSSDA